jgi:AcrR family transcriptional regulator
MSEPAKYKRSSADTIRSIVDAARLEFSAKGLEGARIEDIARRSGKTKQLIHHYYGSKEKLYVAVAHSSFQDAVTDILKENYDALPVREAFLLLMTKMFEQYIRLPELGPLMLDENVHGGVHLNRPVLRTWAAPVLEQCKRILHRGAAEGQFRPVADHEMFYAAAMSLATTCFLTGNVVSSYVSFDITSSDGQTRWRDYSFSILLDSLRP